MQLKTRTLIPFAPIKIFFSKINATYDPKATCPTIDKHFETILKDPSDKKVLYELIGFCLYKEYFLEKGVMFLGNGRNGKGKTLEMIKRFLGAKNCSYQPLQKLGDDPYSRAYLFGKLANIVGDLGSKDINNSEAFKTLTGRDVITGQRKFMSNVEFTNHAKLMFACNNLPKTNDSSLAFFNRWLMFEFPYTFLSQAEMNEFPKNERKNLKLQDPNWVDKLSSIEELNGLFNKALDGLERILTNKSFSNTKGINATKNLWIRKSDSVTAFFNEQLKTAEFEYRISKRIFKKEYSKFCRTNRLRPLSDKMIYNTLTGNEFGVSDFQDYKTGYTYWEGVAFKDGEIVQGDISGNKTSLPEITKPIVTKEVY
jgi:putative DNA primase/helicase